MNPLLCHPAVKNPVLACAEAAVEPAGNGWRFRYRLVAGAGGLRLPAPAQPAAADGLWQHTCCEAFVGASGEPAYREFNFSPCGRWAVYAFGATRQRDAGFRPDAVPVIAVIRNGDDLELVAEVAFSLLPAGHSVEVGLAVVAEDEAGALAYWALHHPSAQPDFHQRAGFALRIDDRQ